MDTGFFLINKPEDWTSHDVVGYIRGVIRAYYKKEGLPAEAKKVKVGHAGTLDPFATGLLIVGVGRASTKRLDEFKNLDKTYTTTLTLGATTDTFDKTGEVTIYHPEHLAGTKHKLNEADSKDLVTTEKITQTLQSFTGIKHQLPPMYSAKKVGGKKLYELARKGIEIERQPSEITIHKIDLISYQFPSLTLRVSCSTGTYIRTLAHDIGQQLGTGAYCDTLHRDSIGPFSAKDAIPPKQISQENWQSFLRDIPPKIS